MHIDKVKLFEGNHCKLKIFAVYMKVQPLFFYEKMSLEILRKKNELSFTEIAKKLEDSTKKCEKDNEKLVKMREEAEKVKQASIQSMQGEIMESFGPIEEKKTIKEKLRR